MLRFRIPPPHSRDPCPEPLLRGRRRRRCHSPLRSPPPSVDPHPLDVGNMGARLLHLPPQRVRRRVHSGRLTARCETRMGERTTPSAGFMALSAPSRVDFALFYIIIEEICCSLCFSALPIFTSMVEFLPEPSKCLTCFSSRILLDHE